MTSSSNCTSTDTSAHLVLQIPDVSGYEPGQALNVEDLFKVGDLVDVAGTSIGKGFQGTGLPTLVTLWSACNNLQLQSCCCVACAIGLKRAA